MMKIVSDGEVFIIPETCKLNILATNGYKSQILDCLGVFFNLKKKTKCDIYDNQGEKLQPGSAKLIYYPLDATIDNNFNFKPKSIFSNEISSIIENNTEDFISMEKIKEDVLSLCTDRGFYKIRKILSEGTGIALNLIPYKLDVSSILQNLEFETDEFSDNQKMMMIYNLLIHLSKDMFKVVYIDFEIDSEVERWLHSIDLSSSIVLIDNESVLEGLEYDDYGFIAMSNCDYLESYYSSNYSIDILNYLFHPVVKRNMEKQTEKNRSLFTVFSDENTTFFIEPKTA